MRFSFLPGIAGLALLAGVEAASAQPPAADTVARIDSIFARFGRAGPGCAVGVSRNGAPVVERAYGLASLEHQIPNTPATIFNAGSLAKQFTASAIVLLAESGQLSLDDDVRRFVPELPDYGTTITLAQLIHHTSGLRDAFALLWLAGGRDDDPTEEEDLLAVIFRQRRLNFTPGAEHLYSNTGYSLLALVVQRVSGKPLKQFAAEQLFGPFGMTRTQFVDNRYAVIPGRATGYRGMRGGWWGHVPYVQDSYGAGNLFTTVGDQLRWLAELPAHPRLYEMARRRGVLAGGDSVAYGAGFELGAYRGARFIAHGGNTSGENAYAMRFTERGLIVVVLCNGREADSFTLARQTAALFLGPPPASPTPATGPALPVISLDARELRRFVGVYYNAATLATRTVGERDGRLLWVRGGPGTPLDPVAPNRFRFPPGQDAELLFPVPAPGQQQELQVLSGGTVTSYRRAEPFAGGRLADYAGRYRSEELDVTLTITAADSAIEVSTPGSWRVRAEPLFRDAFAIPEAAVLHFHRRRGSVTRLEVNMQRARHISFTRLP